MYVLRILLNLNVYIVTSKKRDDGVLSPFKYLVLTMLDTDEAKTRTTTHIRSAGFMSISPSRA